MEIFGKTPCLSQRGLWWAERMRGIDPSLRGVFIISFRVIGSEGSGSGIGLNRGSDWLQPNECDNSSSTVPFIVTFFSSDSIQSVGASGLFVSC